MAALTRIKLSSGSETYRTRTRDNIPIVYRRSRVGSRPRVDPLREEGRRIREHGYNSPFEEIVIAERLRQMGVPTVVPRAVFRTAHRTVKAVHLHDDRRFREHRDLRTPAPESEPILAPGYDYYTIWDFHSGAEPEEIVPGMTEGQEIDPATARERGLLTPAACEALVRNTSLRLRRIGLVDEDLDEREIVLLLDGAGSLRRDSATGEPVVPFSVDALTAFEYGLLDDDAYRRALALMEARLRAVDCEVLNPTGKHLLLSIDPEGRIARDRRGEIRMTLCNFEMVRGLYRPIR